jgi:hypothetical protein
MKSFNSSSTGGPVVVRDSTLSNTTDSTAVVTWIDTDDTNPTSQIMAYFYNNTFKSYNGRPGIWNSDSIVGLEGNTFARMIGTYDITTQPAVQSDDQNATYNQSISSTENKNIACYQNGSIAYPYFLSGDTNSGNFLGANQENHNTNTDIYNCSYYGISL